MDKRTIVPVVLCGGSGTRLWPLSRAMRPKQFISLLGPRSLFQMTLERLDALENAAPPVITCNHEHRFMVAEQLREMAFAYDSILLEPAGRSTAPAIAAAAYKLESAGPDSVMLVLPADHIIGDSAAFMRAIEAAVASALQGNLVTFGIPPHKAATGYGYLKACPNAGDAVPVEQFIEKPDRKTAERLLQQSQYFWNSGMFVFRAATYLEQLDRHQPNMLRQIQQAVDQARPDLDFLRLDPPAYLQCDDISADYAVMELSDSVTMVPLEAGWSDIGSWSALWETGGKDDHGNVTRGDALAIDANNCYLHAENKLVVAQGVDNLALIETHDAILIAPMDDDQAIKKIVAQLEKSNRSEVHLHRQVFRPWGSYDVLDQGVGFQVKRLIVKSGHATSMQKHARRAEHWVVVSGTAEVTCADRTIVLNKSQTAYIPLGATHRLHNPGETALEVIEVQVGDYLGEDDIERIDDQYGRN